MTYDYYTASQEIKTAQRHFDLLKKMADQADTIKSKKRMLSHYEIEGSIFAEECGP